MKKERNIFLNLIFNRQIISYLSQILSSMLFSSIKFSSEQNIEKLEQKIIFLEEKLKTYDREIQYLKAYQQKFFKRLEILLIFICLNLVAITLIIFILLLKFPQK